MLMSKKNLLEVFGEKTSIFDKNLYINYNWLKAKTSNLI